MSSATRDARVARGIGSRWTKPPPPRGRQRPNRVDDGRFYRRHQRLGPSLALRGESGLTLHEVVTRDDAAPPWLVGPVPVDRVGQPLFKRAQRGPGQFALRARVVQRVAPVAGRPIRNELQWPLVAASMLEYRPTDLDVRSLLFFG